MEKRKKMIKSILALDLGTKTGWAAWSDGHLYGGTEKFELERGTSPGLRLLRFRARLQEILAMTKPTLLLYERPHHRGGYSTEVLVHFSGVVIEECARLGIEHEAVHTATLKKAATGSGRAEKKDMIAAAERKWGIKPETDDHADALCLLDYGMKKYAPARDEEKA